MAVVQPSSVYFVVGPSKPTSATADTLLLGRRRVLPRATGKCGWEKEETVLTPARSDKARSNKVQEFSNS